MQYLAVSLSGSWDRGGLVSVCRCVCGGEGGGLIGVCGCQWGGLISVCRCVIGVGVGVGVD